MEHPVVFDANEVSAVLLGHKTVCRFPFPFKTFSLQDKTVGNNDISRVLVEHLGGPGDILWVMERFDIIDDPAALLPGEHDTLPDSFLGDYECDVALREGPNGERWVVDYEADVLRGKKHRVRDIPHPRTGKILRRWIEPDKMPRWASRIELRIEGAWLERLHDITYMGIGDMGVQSHHVYIRLGYPLPQGRAQSDLFAAWWDLRWGLAGIMWKDNPWVWVRQFSVKSVRT